MMNRLTRMVATRVIDCANHKTCSGCDYHFTKKCIALQDNVIIPESYNYAEFKETIHELASIFVKALADDLNREGRYSK